MLNFHTHIPSDKAIVNIDTLEGLIIDPNLTYSIGNHPWYNLFSIQEIEETIKQYPQIIAIGECGIDKLKSNKTLDEQLAIMEKQIQLSEHLKLPLLLHIVNGFNEIIKLRKDLSPKQQWIIHGFNKYKQAEALLKNGFFLSFGVKLMTNEQLQAVFKETPIHKIFLETDNSDIEIQKLYTFASKLKTISLEVLTQQIRTNLSTITNGKLA